MQVKLCLQRLSGFLVNDFLPRESSQSRLSANDKGENEMRPGTLHRSSIYLTAEESPWKPLIGDRLIKAARPIIASNGVPYRQISSVKSHSKSGREKVRRMKGWASLGSRLGRVPCFIEIKHLFVHINQKIVWWLNS